MNICISATGFGTYHADIYRKLASVDSVTIFGRNKAKLIENAFVCFFAACTISQLYYSTGLKFILIKYEMPQ